MFQSQVEDPKKKGSVRKESVKSAKDEPPAASPKKSPVKAKPVINVDKDVDEPAENPMTPNDSFVKLKEGIDKEQEIQ